MKPKQNTYRITRAGCLAVHLRTQYRGDQLVRAVERIVRDGPTTKHEREAVRLANLEKMDDPVITETAGA